MNRLKSAPAGERGAIFTRPEVVDFTLPDTDAGTFIRLEVTVP